jgi:pimeloyl-ACP methyl ester carboxylesterase
VTTTFLAHGHVRLALHELRTGDGPTLLLLHPLADLTPDEVPQDVAGWPGPIHGLDITGHGRSTVPAGGGYTSELLMADADAALAHLGPCTTLGRGLGAYLALMVAGARPDLVRGAVLADGAGIAGGGESPGSVFVLPPIAASEDAPDPWALAELSRDLRPADYATSFVRLAVQFSGLETPITVSARFKPPWLEAVAAEPGVAQKPVAQALAAYAELS